MLNKPSILLFLISILPSAAFSQLYKNDLERCNLKGNVKMIYYKLIHFHEEEIFDSRFSSIARNIHVYFNKEGNIVNYDGFEDEILKYEFLDGKKQNENHKKHYTYNSYGNVIESTVYFTYGFYKDKIKQKKIFEYDHYNKTDSASPFRVTEYEGRIDTTNSGRDLLNFKYGSFSDKEHTHYSFLKNNVSIYNKKKQLVKRYYYSNRDVDADEGYNEEYEEIFEYEYDELGNIILKTQYSIRRFNNRETKAYEYSLFDKNNNWIQKSILCNYCPEVKVIINREITYWEKD
jgi:hypothetical protein